MISIVAIIVCFINTIPALPVDLHQALHFGYTKIARCDFPGNLTVSGAVTEGSVFLREKNDGTVEIYGEINGLTDGQHGFHIHENGGLGNNCGDAGGHFDPAGVSLIFYSNYDSGFQLERDLFVD